MFTTCPFIEETWTTRAISPHYSKHDSTTTAEDLANFLEDVIAKRGQRGNVTTMATGCKPSLVKAGRILEEKVTNHIDCAAHRLQSSASKVFTGTDVDATLGRLRKLMGRYKPSSQATEQLIQ